MNGENHHNTKLKNEDVFNIRKMHSDKTASYSFLAKKYNFEDGFWEK